MYYGLRYRGPKKKKKTPLKLNAYPKFDLLIGSIKELENKYKLFKY